MRAQRPLKKRKIGIATQVFIGLGLGLLVGVFFGEKVAFLKIGGDAFIALLQITVIPYVMVALITSLGRLTLADAKALGLQGGGILIALWAVGLVVVLLTPLAFPDWPSASFFSVSERSKRQNRSTFPSFISRRTFFPPYPMLSCRRSSSSVSCSALL
jgi:Na+/H+-dicarboxylate symporter